MSIGARGLKTKKDLKALIGKRLSNHFIETSAFGPEYPPSGTGTVTMVGPDAYQNRKWSAIITLKEGVIVKVE